MIIRIKTRFILGLSLIGLGAALLFLSFLGQWTDLGSYRNHPPRAWENFDAALSKEARDFDSLFKAAEKRAAKPFKESTQEEIMNYLYDVVTCRFTHGEARHTLFSNWILWTLGKVHPGFGHIRDPEILVSKGHSLLCDQSSYLLLNLALEAGIRARHVGLYGHVVMEAWYDNDWHLYDPDMEVIAGNGSGRVIGVEELSRDEQLLQKLYSGPKESACGAIATRENNTFVSYPLGSQFEWKSQVLLKIEQFMEVIKFLIPVLMLLAGFFWCTFQVLDGNATNDEY